MANFCVLVCVLAIAAVASSPALAEEDAALVAKKREPRNIQAKLCLKLGICGGGYGGHQGGYGGHQGGYGGHQGGYYPYPPINIGISQSQSSSSAGGGGFGSSSYPNNYQYNGGYPNHGGYSGNKRPGYFGNGYGSYNNQFNGNYYGGQPGHGGYGFQKPFGYKYDSREEDYDDYGRSAKNKD